MLTKKKELSVGQFLQTQVEAYGEKEFIYDENQRLTYREYNLGLKKEIKLVFVYLIGMKQPRFYLLVLR